MGKNKLAKKKMKLQAKLKKKSIKRSHKPKDGVFGDVTNRTY